MSVEKTLERKLREAVKSAGGLALKFHCLSFTGMPDRMILLPGGRILFVELKSTGKPLRPRQDFVIGWLRKKGFCVFVIDSQEHLEDFIIPYITSSC